MNAQNHPQPNVMLPEDAQVSLEQYYHRKHIDAYLREALADFADVQEAKDRGVQMLTDWHQNVQGPEVKKRRLAQLDVLKFPELVEDIFVATAYCQTPQLLTSVSAQLATRLGFEDHADSIRTAVELLTVVCETDVFDITPGPNKQTTSWYVQSNIGLPDALHDAWERSQYLPPMVAQPRTVTSNFQSAYLSFNDSLLLGKNATHDGDICLGVINTQNQVALSLYEPFLLDVPERPKTPPATAEEQKNWKHFLGKSRGVYNLVLKHGNRFYLTNKPDKRGRLYAQGYHVTTQGSAYKKAMIELADKEVVQGVP